MPFNGGISCKIIVTKDLIIYSFAVIRGGRSSNSYKKATHLLTLYTSGCR